MPLRSFLITFSAVSASRPGLSMSKVASDSPPDLRRSVWQGTQ